jgi:hypothetical protein
VNAREPQCSYSRSVLGGRARVGAGVVDDHRAGGRPAARRAAQRREEPGAERRHGERAAHGRVARGAAAGAQRVAAHHRRPGPPVDHEQQRPHRAEPLAQPLAGPHGHRLGGALLLQAGAQLEEELALLVGGELLGEVGVRPEPARHAAVGCRGSGWRATGTSATCRRGPAAGRCPPTACPPRRRRGSGARRAAGGRGGAGRASPTPASRRTWCPCSRTSAVVPDDAPRRVGHPRELREVVDHLAELGLARRQLGAQRGAVEGAPEQLGGRAHRLDVVVVPGPRRGRVGVEDGDDAAVADARRGEVGADAPRRVERGVGRGAHGARVVHGEHPPAVERLGRGAERRERQRSSASGGAPGAA